MEPQGAEAGTTPVCYRHPDRVTYLACTRCERPICGDCSIEAAVGQRCPTCVMEQGTQQVIRRPSQRRLAERAPVTMTILVVTILAYVVASVVPGARSLVILQPAAVLAGDWWRIFTHSLGHGGFLHLGVNMYALYILGQGLEARLGRLPFVSVWLFSAVAGGVAVTYLADPLSGTVGASGAVFGLFGIWLGSAWVQRGSAAGNAQLRSILSLLAINAFISLLPGISWQGHLGGLNGGVVAFAILRAAKDRSAASILLLGLAGILVFATQL